MGTQFITTAAQRRAAALRRYRGWRNAGLRDALRAMFADGLAHARADAIAAMVSVGFEEEAAGRELSALAGNVGVIKGLPGMPLRSVVRGVQAGVLAGLPDAAPVRLPQREFVPLTRADHDVMAAWRLCPRDPMTDERHAAISHRGSA